ncbi:MAG: hypothetical protein NT086_07760 [Proteobacteria bacterium]|nr:hypothetical protein [Pseudomonadota bacterium]
MKVVTLVLNAAGEPHFRQIDYLNFEALIGIAKEREASIRNEGADFAAGAISAFGSEVIKAVNYGNEKDIDRAITNMLMATWMLDSVFLKVSADTYRNTEQHFIISDDGIVQHTRAPLSENDSN